MKKNKKAYSLVEVMIVLFMTVSISALAFRGMITLSKGIKRPKDIAVSKNDLGVFVNGLYKFINNSFSAYLVDPALITTPPALDYINTSFGNADPRQDILYLVKDENDSTGRIVYNNSLKQLEYYKDNTSAAQIMLEKVYRIDAIWDINGNLATAGSEPIFKFPHTEVLYDSKYSPPRPKVVIIQLLRIVAEGGSEFLKPITIPLTLMIEVNVSTFETV